MPAKVEKWEPESQTVDVQPLVDRVDNVDGERVTKPMPVIAKVPVAFHRFGGFTLRMPISVGDIVGLLVSDRELENWLGIAAGASRAQTVEPRSGRMHAIDDAVAYPGITPFSQPISDVGDGDLVLGREDGGGSVRIKPNGDIILGSDSATKEGVARLKDQITSSATVLNHPDTAFWQWVLAVHAFIMAHAGEVDTNLAVATPTNGAVAQITYAAAAASPPTQLVGEITTASAKASTE